MERPQRIDSADSVKLAYQKDRERDISPEEAQQLVAIRFTEKQWATFSGRPYDSGVFYARPCSPIEGEEWSPYQSRGMYRDVYDRNGRHLGRFIRANPVEYRGASSVPEAIESSASEKPIPLPRRDVMLARLNEVSDVEHMQQGLYPKLLEKFAGRSILPVDCAKILLAAMEEYTKGMIPATKKVIYMYLDDLIDALVENKTRAAQVKACFVQVPRVK